MNQKIKTIILSALICFSFGGLSVATVNAASSSKDQVLGGANSATEDRTDLKDTFKKIINTLLFITGMVAVIMIVIGGLRYVTSNGDQNAVSSAKNTVLYSIIGLVVAIMAYAIVNFVITNI